LSEEDEEFEEFFESDHNDQSQQLTDNSNKISNNSCFIIFWECLSELFDTCRKCTSSVVAKKHYLQGALLSITTKCEKGHTFQWNSQKKNGKQPEGNILIAASLTLSGILFNQMTVFCNTLKLNFFTRTIYDKFLKLYIGPVICNVWEKEKKKFGRT